MVAQGTTRADPVYYSDVMPGALSPGCSGGSVLQKFAPTTGAGLQTGIFSRYDAPGQIIGVPGWQEGPNMSSTHLGDEEQAVCNADQSASVT
ncbi:hypothetical protein [Streptomyces sp. NPDC006971]|uniref:hypothetical protein n=1 Tax=Streptomyces sp. NPDC006971 TaxID=3154784 RepID=UPI00340DBE0B